MKRTTMAQFVTAIRLSRKARGADRALAKYLARADRDPKIEKLLRGFAAIQHSGVPAPQAPTANP